MKAAEFGPRRNEETQEALAETCLARRFIVPLNLDTTVCLLCVLQERHIKRSRLGRDE